MKARKLIALGLMCLLINTGCMYAIRYDGPYKGRVIDAETGEPLVGVVIVGVWNREHAGPGGATHTYYDARETVTDDRGEFEMPGLGIEVFSNVEPMNVLIFKAGYEYYGLGPWEGLKVGYLWSKRVTWEGSRAIIPLKKLTLEERKKRDMPDLYMGKRYDKQENITHSCLPQKINLFPKEVNKERLELGRIPYDLEKGRCEK